MLKINGFLGNNAVLQHGQELTIAGKAAPAHSIKCVINQVEVTTLSSSKGEFRLKLPPMLPAGPLDIEISDIDSKERVTYHDIYIGNVYLIAGQSNMALNLGEADDILPDYYDKLIRQLEIKKQALLEPDHENFQAHWQTAENDNLETFSALGFHFARKLRKETPDIAIGLVNSSYGGTNIQSWISKESLLKCPETKEQVKIYESKVIKLPKFTSENVPEREELELQVLKEIFSEPPPNDGFKKGWHKYEYDYRDWSEIELPDSWTLAGYERPGAFWFRRKIELPESWVGNPIELHLGSIENHDVCYWNGVEIGHSGSKIETRYLNECRCYSIPAELVKAGENQLAVRVYSFFPIYTNGGFNGPEDKIYLRCDKELGRKIPLSGKWKYKLEKLHYEDIYEHFRKIGAGEPHSYHIMFDNMISPLRECKFAGVAFYQGEANTLGKNDNYEQLLKLLIKDWQAYFGQPDLPFFIIQLPGFHIPRLHSEYSTWAKIREAQLKAGLSIGIPPVVLAESGLTYDLHPPDKSIPGKRLAMTVLSVQGNSNFPLSGPVYKNMEKLPEGKIRLHFELYGNRMVINGDHVKHLVIAGTDGVFHEAESKLDSPETLLVWSDAVPHPQAVRYGWCENPAGANLYNQAGQPASPFRTDTEYN